MFAGVTADAGTGALTGGSGNAATITYGEGGASSIDIEAAEVTDMSTMLVAAFAADATPTGVTNDMVEDAITEVDTLRAGYGAQQNQLEHAANNMATTKENLQSAESRVRDVDMAEEMMIYTKNNILLQASQAMLAQANAQPQGVLQLLQ